MTTLDIPAIIRPGYVDPTPLDASEMLQRALMDERFRQIIAAFNKVGDGVLIERMLAQDRTTAARQVREAAAEARAAMEFHQQAVDALDGLARRLEDIARRLEARWG